jgi:hypothetical protein
MDGRIKQRRCRIEHISFAAHVDFTQNSAFIRAVHPDNIILVHGEKTGMRRLKEELEREIRRNWAGTHRPSVAMPENGTKVKLQFNKSLEAEVVGSAATALLNSLDEGQTETDIPPDALLVTENFSSRVLLVPDLVQFTPCRTGLVKQRAVVPLPVGFGLQSITVDMLYSWLSESLSEIEIFHTSEDNSSSMYLLVHNIISIYPPPTTPTGMMMTGPTPGIVVAWSASPSADLIADGKCYYVSFQQYTHFLYFPFLSWIAVIGTLSQALSVPSILRRSLAPRPDIVQGPVKRNRLTATT